MAAGSEIFLGIIYYKNSEIFFSKNSELFLGNIPSSKHQ
jgi:hypothetical protein